MSPDGQPGPRPGADAAVRKSKSPLTRALGDLVVPWARGEGFTAHSPYLFVRGRDDIGAKEIVEFQRSNRHPYRMYTVNLGLFHPDWCEDAPPCPEPPESVHCGREVRIGHLMKRSFLFRLPLWYRFGSGWHFFNVIPPYGDFWWQYAEGREGAVLPVSDTLRQLATVGLQWFRDLRRYSTVAEAFDPRGYAWYEMGGARTRGIDLGLKPK